MRVDIDRERAFLDAFDAYADALYRHCFFRISDRERAKDLVSEAFTRTWEYLVKGNTVGDYKSFLYRTLNHLIIDEYRKKKTESLDNLLDEHHVPESAFDELVGGGKEEIEIAGDVRCLPKLLEHMPAQYREVVVMRYLDGLAPSDIAKLLDEPVNTVSVRIHRGITWLTKHVQQKRP